MVFANSESSVNLGHLICASLLHEGAELRAAHAEPKCS